VKVVVDYTFPLNIPFWRSTSIQTESTSEMVISN
jgi:hypothetical protein